MPRQKFAATLVRPGQAAGTWTYLVVDRDRGSSSRTSGSQRDGAYISSRRRMAFSDGTTSALPEYWPL